MSSIRAVAVGLLLFGAWGLALNWVRTVGERESLEECRLMGDKSLEELEVDVGLRLGDGRPVQMSMKGCPPRAAKVVDWNPRR